MERVIQRFASFEEAGKADREYLARISAKERERIFDEILTRGRGPDYDPNSDWREFMESLNSRKVEYALVIG